MRRPRRPEFDDVAEEDEQIARREQWRRDARLPARSQRSRGWSPKLRTGPRWSFSEYRLWSDEASESGGVSVHVPRAGSGHRGLTELLQVLRPMEFTAHTLKRILECKGTRLKSADTANGDVLTARPVLVVTM